MNAYRVKLILQGPLGTAMVSGTLWGHLAWAVHYVRGQSAFQAWLEEQKKRPWLVSSAMPEGMLPRPLLKGTRRDGQHESLKDMEREKALRKISWIPENVFRKVRDAVNEASLVAELLPLVMGRQTKKANHRSVSETVRAHNRIDRRSGTTPELGGLHFEDLVSYGSPRSWQVFVAAESLSIHDLKELFDFIGMHGFGANASTGSGGFCVEIQETDLLEQRGNRAMSLSHGIVGENMLDTRYKQHVHFGKLGGDYAKGGYSPFKYPILMAQPGATFTPRGKGPFGAILEGVHHDPKLAHICHYAVHLPLFFTEGEA